MLWRWFGRRRWKLGLGSESVGKKVGFVGRVEDPLAGSRVAQWRDGGCFGVFVKEETVERPPPFGAGAECGNGGA